jgi:hypothetical protein
MSATTLQLFAVSALIGECRALAASGILNPAQAAALRFLVNHTHAGGLRSPAWRQPSSRRH